MARRTGSADLPLHGGRVPPWLATRMSSLGVVITQAIVYHYGRDEFLRRLSHPFWFQSFGALMGMDWHSSGITTSVIGALKRGLGPLSGELGIHVCGGRGQHSRKTPDELRLLGERIGFDGAKLTRASRLVAKVDSAAVQDGFDLYLHGFFVTDEGKWTVVQQGMNGDKKQARRYHWHSENLKSFVDEPHSAIDGPAQGEIVNLTDKRAEISRAKQIDLLEDLGPDRIVSELAALTGETPAQALLPHLIMPAHHDVRSGDVFTRRLHGTLAAAAERGPADFPDLLLTPGVGARTVRSLAMVAEVVHGAPYRFRDPARFSLAHGGKDRHPYPVPIKVYSGLYLTICIDGERFEKFYSWSVIFHPRSLSGNEYISRQFVLTDSRIGGFVRGISGVFCGIGGFMNRIVAAVQDVSLIENPDGSENNKNESGNFNKLRAPIFAVALFAIGVGFLGYSVFKSNNSLRYAVVALILAWIIIFSGAWIFLSWSMVRTLATTTNGNYSSTVGNRGAETDVVKTRSRLRATPQNTQSQA